MKVNGVGAAKSEKYGQRFLDEIKAFVLQHPEAVTSIPEDENSEK